MNQFTMRPADRSNILFIVAGSLIVFGLVFLSAGLFSLQRESQYATESESTSGTVLSKTVEERWSTDSSTKRQTKSTFYKIHYRFRGPDGQEIESSSGVSSWTYDQTREGSPIKIQYLKSDTNNNRVYQDPDYIFGSVFSGVGSLTMFIGVGILAYEIKKRRLISRLSQDGLSVEAVVESVGPGNMSINGIQQWQIAYCFTDFQGKKHSCKTSHLPPQMASEWKAGDKGTVRYDKNDAKQNIWIGRA